MNLGSDSQSGNSVHLSSSKFNQELGNVHEYQHFTFMEVNQKMCDHVVFWPFAQFTPEINHLKFLGWQAEN